jgi:hypothetical protein
MAATPTTDAELKALAEKLVRINRDMSTHRESLKALAREKERTNRALAKLMQATGRENGFKSNGRVFVKKQQVVRTRRTQTDKAKNITETLRQHGVACTDDLVHKLLEASRGQKKVVDALVQKQLDW